MLDFLRATMSRTVLAHVGRLTGDETATELAVKLPGGLLVWIHRGDLARWMAAESVEAEIAAAERMMLS